MRQSWKTPRWALIDTQPEMGCGDGIRFEVYLDEDLQVLKEVEIHTYPDMEVVIGTNYGLHPGFGTFKSLSELKAAWLQREADRFDSNRRCRVCGCTDIAACVTDDGPCHWVKVDLCSACEGGRIFKLDPRRTPA